MLMENSKGLLHRSEKAFGLVAVLPCHAQPLDEKPLRHDVPVGFGNVVLDLAETTKCGRTIHHHLRFQGALFDRRSS